jgi:polysaccharide deacetylase 2 family uncharacterized protein YibQ
MFLSSFAIILIVALYPSFLLADKTQIEDQRTTYIALIIDDLGYRPSNDKRAIMLPGQICYAFLPNTPHAKKLSLLAYQHDKEIMLHLPMESVQGRAEEKNVLTTKMDKDTFIKILDENITAVPNISGLNNHMGSLLSQSSQHMNWLMSYLITKNLFFIDSRTSSKTIAEEVAHDYRIPSTRRNVFLDHVHTLKAINKQFQRLIKIAKKNGSALAIGHPFELTLSFLEKNLPKLEKQGIKLVSVKELIDIQNQ